MNTKRAFTERNRKAAADREGRLLGYLIVECVIVVVVILFQLFH